MTSKEYLETTLSATVPNDLASLIRGFQAHLTLGTRPRAAITIRAYVVAVRDFGTWWGERPLHEVNHRLIDEYIRDWQLRFQERRGTLPATQTLLGRFKALSAFFRYLERLDEPRDEEGTITPNPMRKVERPRTEKKPIDFLTTQEDEVLLASVVGDFERVCVCLPRFTGLRVAEMAALTQGMVDLGNERLLYRGPAKMGSSSARREILIFPVLTPVLRQWFANLDRRGLRDDRKPLLLGRHGNPLGRPGITYYIKKAAIRGGLRPVPSDRWPTGVSTEVCPHLLRRTFATWLLNQRVPLNIVSRLLGHSHTSITEDSYAELLPETMKQTLREVMGF